MSVLLAAALAGAAAGVLVALPPPGQLRFDDLSASARRSPERRRSLPWAAGLLPAVAVGLVVGPVVALLLALAFLVARRWLVQRRTARDVAAERTAAVQACAALAGELSAGRTPAEALAAAADVAVGPAGDALAGAAAAAALGGDVPGALTAATERSAVAPALRALGACWTVCSASGSGLAAAASRLEDGLRAEAAQRRAVDAELAGPRATAALLAVLPVFGLLLSAGLGADPLHVLLETPLGLGCLVLGLSLEGLGLLWTGRLVARAGGTG